MADIMEGVRILEVAEHTFVPAASAILADWGAEVIKVEHPERGDAMRGLASSGVMPSMGAVHVLLEHSNRGKKSIGIDVSTREGPRPDLPAGRDVRRLPDQQGARRPEEAAHRARGHQGPQPEHHLRGRDRRGRARARSRPRRLRLLELLVPGRQRHGDDAHRCRLPRRATRTGLRGLHRRDDHRRRDPGRAVPPGADGRGPAARRLVARRGHVGHEPGHRPVAPARHALASRPQPRGRPRPPQPARRHLPDPGRPVPGLLVPAGIPLLAERLPGHRARGADHRRAVLLARAAGGQRRRRPRHPEGDLRVGAR